MSADLHLLTNLQTLNAASSGLTGTLDLHGVTTLLVCDASGNGIDTLTVSGCSGLDNLGCFSCPSLTTIDLTNTLLGYIDFHDSPASAMVLPAVIGNAIDVCNGNGAALNQTRVDGLLTLLDNCGSTSGNCDLAGGTNSPPSSTGPGSPYDNLIVKGWTVSVNP